MPDIQTDPRTLASLTTPLDPGPVDLRALDATLSHLRRAARDVDAMATFLTDARDRLAVAPDDPEARHAVSVASLQMRGEATALAQQFAGLAVPEWAIP